MATQPHTLLALSSAVPLWLTVGVLLVAVLLAAFVLGHRRSAERRKSASTPSPQQVAQARQELENPPHRGADWSTPDEDPEHGHPHR